LIVVSKDPPRRAVLLLAVPAAVVHLLGQQPIDDALHVLAEVIADGHGGAVDAGLDLTVEERQVVVLPAHVLADQVDRAPDAGVGRDGAEQPQDGQGGLGPGPFREVRAAAPAAIGTLQAEKPRAPALVRHAGALRGDHRGRLVEEVAHDLPTDRGVGIEQPIHDGHARIIASRT
jgi:hypothetical protein